MPDTFETIVIGGGPGGYVAAIRSAQLGRRPPSSSATKPAAAASITPASRRRPSCARAELYYEAKNGADLGIVTNDIAIDWDALQKRRGDVSATLSGGVEGLWKKNKIDFIEGDGALDKDGNVVVGDTTYEAGAVILATGSVALPIPGVEFGERRARHLGRLDACRRSRRRSPSSAPAPRARRSPPPTRASAPR